MMGEKPSRCPAVSIVLPTYNNADGLRASIASVRAQTLPNWQLVIVDDGSTDTTAALLEGIADPRILVIRQPNSGAGHARNSGIDAATARFIAFLDAGDIYLPHHLQRAVDVLSATEQASCIYAPVEVHRQGCAPFNKPPRALRIGEPMADYVLADRGFLQTSTLVLHADIARATRFDATLPMGQDTDFAIRLASAGVRFFHFPTPSVIYHDSGLERVSMTLRPAAREAWLNRLRGHLSNRAYRADQGWVVAKGYARQGQWGKAFSRYARAVFRGCYSTRLAVTVGLQIVLSPTAYRMLSAWALRAGVRP